MTGFDGCNIGYRQCMLSEKLQCALRMLDVVTVFKYVRRFLSRQRVWQELEVEGEPVENSGSQRGSKPGRIDRKCADDTVAQALSGAITNGYSHKTLQEPYIVVQ